MACSIHSSQSRDWDLIVEELHAKARACARSFPYLPNKFIDEQKSYKQGLAAAHVTAHDPALLERIVLSYVGAGTLLPASGHNLQKCAAEIWQFLLCSLVPAYVHSTIKQKRPIINENGLPEDTNWCIRKLSSRHILLAIWRNRLIYWV